MVEEGWGGHLLLDNGDGKKSAEVLPLLLCWMGLSHLSDTQDVCWAVACMIWWHCTCAVFIPNTVTSDTYLGCFLTDKSLWTFPKVGKQKKWGSFGCIDFNDLIDNRLLFLCTSSTSKVVATVIQLFKTMFWDFVLESGLCFRQLSSLPTSQLDFNTSVLQHCSPGPS